MKNYLSLTRTFVLFLVLLTLFSGCSGNPDQKKKAHYQKALKLIEQQKDNAAIIELKNAIQLDPKFADARYQLGLLYLKIQQPRKAFGQLQRVSSLDPDNTDARIKTASLYFSSGDTKAAKSLVEAILNSHPDNVEALALQARIFISENALPKALDSINTALERKPNLDRLYTIKGQILARQGNYAQAEKTLKEAINVNPGNMTNYDNLLNFYTTRGAQLAQKKDFDQAQAEWKKATALNDQMINKFPDKPLPLMRRIALDQQRGNKEKALKEFQEATQRFPDNIAIWTAEAKFYHNLGKNEAAENAYKSALAHAPEKAKNQVKGQLANFYFDTRQFQKAKDLMEQILAQAPKNGLARLVKAKFFLKDKKVADSLNILSELVKQFPSLDEPFFVKAKAHMMVGEREMALAAIQEALRRNPRNSLYHTILAHLYFIAGELEGARKEAAVALQLNKTNFRATLIFINTFLKNKEYDNARRMLEKLAKELPDNPEVLGNLGLAYLGLKDLDNALATFEKVLKIQPANNPALIKVVQIMSLQKKKPEELINRVEEQIQKAPDSASNLILLATLHMGRKQYDKAFKLLKKARELSPQNPWTYSLSADILNRQHKTDQAIAEFQALQKQRPKDPAVYMALGSLFEQKGDIAKAKKQYRQALAVKPDFAPAANNLAWLISEEKEPDLGEALRLAMIAKQQLPEEVHIADTLGWVHYKRRSFALALHEFAFAVNKQPEEPVFRYHMALALYDQGRRETARRELEKALQQSRPFAARKEAEATLARWKSQEK